MSRLENINQQNLSKDEMVRILGAKTKNTIIVKGLPLHTVETDIETLFAECGTITEIKLPLDYSNPDGKTIKGFGFVTFENEKSARKALNYDGHKYFGKRIKVEIAEQKNRFEPELSKNDNFSLRNNENIDRNHHHKDKKKYRSRSRSKDKRRERRNSRSESSRRRHRHRSRSVSSSKSDRYYRRRDRSREYDN